MDEYQPIERLRWFDPPPRPAYVAPLTPFPYVAPAPCPHCHRPWQAMPIVVTC